ncbi:ABC transporter ATP-binding protein|uniref:Nickel transport system ATP-binding protein n=1 Tax=Dendrosporobacter quercicolus TaxID=146817 RepID=A0A1G9QUW0_9FIRM|nr:dipeptide/oligopeptide/nickel ABC transporter ATP-binding protein [Dendrosporobacter quercicolus]NSL48373.1 ABC transporter ATP-binding protein [Dendrosporobacter quercicolus DSM 1736]SDM14802.1 nickel transport system ATP-binding protein [Dendrosporobacter quercicolus]
MLLKVQEVYKDFSQGGFFSAAKKPILKGVSLELACGECLGLIGESGSGKSTLGRMLIGIEKPDWGEVLFEGRNIYRSPGWRQQPDWRRKISAVFQDYTSSVNPRFRVDKIITEPLYTHRLASGSKAMERAVYLLEKVGLGGDYLKRYPHQLSGGQLQRVCIARALATNPAFILLDEPVSSLDVSVQVQVMDLLDSLKKEFQLSYLFISHDLAAVAYLCDRALFFAEGRIVEAVERIAELGQVKEAYSRKLLYSVLDFSDQLADYRCGREEGSRLA